MERLIAGEVLAFSGVVEDAGGEGLWLSSGISVSGFGSGILACD
jgi:hypothetical protein